MLSNVSSIFWLGWLIVGDRYTTHINTIFAQIEALSTAACEERVKFDNCDAASNQASNALCIVSCLA